MPSTQSKGKGLANFRTPSPSRGCIGGHTGRAGSQRGGAPVQIEATPPKKGKNFSLEEERQLTRSVLAILQDPIAGNQQKCFAY